MCYTFGPVKFNIISRVGSFQLVLGPYMRIPVFSTALEPSMYQLIALVLSFKMASLPHSLLVLSCKSFHKAEFP